MSRFLASDEPSALSGAAIYHASVPLFIRGLRALGAELAKAEASATERKFDSTVLVNARLAPDMLSLAGQVQRASDTSKLSAERLSGVASPRFPDNEASIAELQQRVAATVAYLEGLDPASFADSDTRIIEVSLGRARGDTYLLQFALPNFYFHIATAHAILRHNGVAVGKLDYLAMHEPTA